MLTGHHKYLSIHTFHRAGELGSSTTTTQQQHILRSTFWNAHHRSCAAMGERDIDRSIRSNSEEDVWTAYWQCDSESPRWLLARKDLGFYPHRCFTFGILYRKSSLALLLNHWTILQSGFTFQASVQDTVLELATHANNLPTMQRRKCTACRTCAQRFVACCVGATLLLLCESRSKDARLDCQ